MDFKMRGEALAKIGIYLISSTMLFIALFVWQDAQVFEQSYVQATEVSLDDMQVSTPAEALPSSSVQQQPQSSAPAVQDAQDLPVEEFITAPSVKDALVLQAENRPNMLPNYMQLPPIEEQLVLPAEEYLQAEVARLEGMGVGFPSEISPEFVGDFHATAYCCEVYPHICGGNGVTASGTVPTPGLTCATDWGVLPPGTWLFIEDVGIRRVEDSGSAILGARLDIAVDTHVNALAWPGFGSHRVWVLSWSEW